MSSGSYRPRRFIPKLEELGVRLCPSVTIQANGGELRVDGNDAADVVSITDNGQGAVSVTANGQTSAFAGISQIQVQTRGGNDTITANLALSAGSTGSVEALVKGNEGDDQLTLNVTGSAAALKARLDGDAGFDRFAATANVQLEEVEARL